MLIKQLKKYLILSASSIVCTFLLYLVMGLIIFPSEIRLVEGGSHKVSFNLPVSATIETDAVTVINVNNEPVKENIKINLNEEVNLEPSASGTAKMTLNAFGIPLKSIMLDILPDLEVMPSGMTVGVKINTDGILVLGTGFVKNESGASVNPCDGILKSGDLLISANGEELRNKEHLRDIIKVSGETIEFKVKRNDSVIPLTVNTVKSKEEHENKIGVWVRDSTQGIGTVTYVNPQTMKFAALGHGIADIDTKKLMTVKSGEIMASEVSSVKKGKKGSPGELVGDINSANVLGEVKLNNPCGIYGVMNMNTINSISNETVKIQTQDKIHEGPAKIRSNIEGSNIKEYDVYIESINRYSSDDTRGMVIKITDPSLLSKTSGIVQGMSGSPILQDGKLIGAITHVFVQEPSKGYGIFIENMMKQERLI